MQGEPAAPVAISVMDGIGDIETGVLPVGSDRPADDTWDLVVTLPGRRGLGIAVTDADGLIEDAVVLTVPDALAAVQGCGCLAVATVPRAGGDAIVASVSGHGALLVATTAGVYLVDQAPGGGYAAPIVVRAGAPRAAAVGDLDGDGVEDIVWSDAGGAHVLLGVPGTSD